MSKFNTDNSANLLSRLNWLNTIFLIVSPILVVVFVPMHIIVEGLDWRLIALFIFYCFATGLSITAGYHRLFAHRSYEASLPVKLFYLFFGASALQGSAMKWSADHRRHHKFVDKEEDPYRIGRGFFYAHMGWVFYKDDPKYLENKPADLKADKWIVWQDKYNFPIAIIVGFLLPTLIGLSLGAPWGGLLFGCLARVVITHHTTFFINSLCHMWGSQPYNTKNTAKDNFILAFLTYGEGYHNFHHRFESDYRNGILWYQWDPTKWLIKILSFLGLTKNLRKVSDAEILRAKLLAQEVRLVEFGIYNDRFKELRIKIEEAQKQIAVYKKRYTEIKKDLTLQKDETIVQIKIELKLAKIELDAALEQWRLLYQVQTAAFTF
jgi:stearoyl-CoA desaturase (delta-9 desaturase)